MTNHWRDIRNSDLILINGANPAEAHPVGFQWFMRAKLDPTKGPGKGGGAKMIHADPRFSRTSAVSDMYLRIRTGTDVAYFGGLINYVLQNKKYFHDYVVTYTNAATILTEDYSDTEDLDGVFTYLCVTGDALGVAKDEMAAKPLVLYEADDIVALASEEIAIRAIVDHEIETWDPYEGEVMVWQR